MSNEIVSNEQITTPIQQYIAQTFLYDKPDFALTADTLLFGARIIDSLQLFQLISFLEERFHCQIQASDVSLDNFASIATIAEMMKRYQV